MHDHRRHTPHSRPALRLIFGLALILWTVSVATGSAQVPDTLEPGEALYAIELADGEEIVARVVAIEGDRLTLETAGGVQLELARGSVRRMELARGRVHEGEFWVEDPHATQLFLGPTARSMHQGSGQLAVYELIMPFVSFGVTDRFSLAGGMPVLLGSLSVYYIAPKLQLYTEPKLSVAVGALAFGEVGESNHYGVGYGVVTMGDPDAALTLGLGWGLAGSEVSDRPAVLIGGETRVSRRVKLMTENYIAQGVDGPLVSGGLRFISERLSADVGMGAVLPGACCLPLVNFSYTFGPSNDDR